MVIGLENDGLVVYWWNFFLNKSCVVVLEFVCFGY